MAVPVMSDERDEIVEEFILVDGVFLLVASSPGNDSIMLHLALVRHAQGEITLKVGRVAY